MSLPVSAAVTSFAIGTAAPTSGPAQVLWKNFYRADDVAIPDGFVDIDAAVAAIEKDDASREGISRARIRIAESLPESVRGLAYLRLRRGWSQKRLAEEIGTSQPHIARIEAGRDNVYLKTANQLARALNVSITEINIALGFGLENFDS